MGPYGTATRPHDPLSLLFVLCGSVLRRRCATRDERETNEETHLVVPYHAVLQERHKILEVRRRIQRFPVVVAQRAGPAANDEVHRNVGLILSVLFFYSVSGSLGASLVFTAPSVVNPLSAQIQITPSDDVCHGKGV